MKKILITTVLALSILSAFTTEPPTLSIKLLPNRFIRVSFEGKAGGVYSLQYKESLNSTQWLNVPNGSYDIPDDRTITRDFNMCDSPSMRFYRVIRWF